MLDRLSAMMTKMTFTMVRLIHHPRHLNEQIDIVHLKDKLAFIHTEKFQTRLWIGIAVFDVLVPLAVVLYFI